MPPNEAWTDMTLTTLPQTMHSSLYNMTMS